MSELIKNIDREATLQTAQIENDCIWYHQYLRQDCLNKEGRVVESGLIIDDECGTVVKITMQFSIDFYINKKGEYIKTEAPEVDPFIITVYNEGDQLKTLYKVIEVQRDVPFNITQLEEEKKIAYEKQIR